MTAEASSTRILMLHRVLNDEPTAFGLPSCYRMRGTALTPAEFEQVLDQVGPGILPLQAVEDALLAGHEPPAGCVLTFDDGYREHLDLVAPLLRARGQTATFYVATGLHGAGDRTAVVDAWYWLLDHARAAAATVPLPGGGRFHGRLDTASAKEEWVAGRPKKALLAARPAEQERMLCALAESAGADLPRHLAASLYLEPGEWRHLVDLGMRVGAHSASHPRLTELDDAALADEIDCSVRIVGQLGGPCAFAYPDGAYDDRVVDFVHRAGVRSSVTCEPGVVRAGMDMMALPREFVHPGWLAG
ncbi:MAG: polysaccharide deacetylase family protein [Alphaproteobacteria bacterium]|nr:polysaccharide deacetylase family protein [Alphaproteobacteria bacterium]